MFFIRRSKKLAASAPTLTPSQAVVSMVELTEAQERQLWEMEQDRRARQRRARAAAESAAVDEAARAERLRRAENLRRSTRVAV